MKTKLTINKPNWKNRTLFIGDNLDVMRKMPDNSVDTIVTDPPYNTGKFRQSLSGTNYHDNWAMSDIRKGELIEISELNPDAFQIIMAAECSHGKKMKAYLIMMGIRLIEMKRILKPTGSIWIQCDDYAHAYLKSLMDAIFGKKNFRNAITWKRTDANNAVTKQCGKIKDTLLFYTMSEESTWNQPRVPLSEKQLKSFKYTDPDTKRIYALYPLDAPNHNPDKKPETWRGATPGKTRTWAHSLDKREQMLKEGLIKLNDDGTAKLAGHIKYLDEHPGAKLQDIWMDIPRIPNNSKERCGQTTQKPLNLNIRMISATSNPNQIILDPFCGCSSTLIAAELLKRRWVGIDCDKEAIEKINDRLTQPKEYGIGLPVGILPIIHDTATKGFPRLAKSTTKHRQKNWLVRLEQILLENNKWTREQALPVLFEYQEGKCNLCGIQIPPRLLQIDHILSQKRGGEDNIENLQLLCGSCNIIKGGYKTMKEAGKELKKKHGITPIKPKYYKDRNKNYN